MITFVFDDTSVKSYTSAVTAVPTDYVSMLEPGLVDDVDGMIQKYYDTGLRQIHYR